MSKLDELLSELNFTRYEAQALKTLIEFDVLDARTLSDESGVPQPKIYETLSRLEERGLIHVRTEGPKKLFKIKSRSVLKSKILDYPKKLKSIAEESLNIIDDIYGSKDSQIDIPFIGFAGLDSLKDHLISFIESAKKSLVLFLHKNYFDDNVINAINHRSQEIEVKAIFQDLEDIIELKKKIPNIQFYQLKYKSFEIVKILIKHLFNRESIKELLKANLLPEDSISQMSIPGPSGINYGVQIFKEIAEHVDEIFGIALIDSYKSFFRIPIPVPTPMAIVSTLPEIVEFHANGLNSIINTSTLIDKIDNQ